jgi:hypothetical protein
MDVKIIAEHEQVTATSFLPNLAGLYGKTLLVFGLGLK